MTNYVGFINSMLELRDQRLKEAIAKAEMQQKQMEEMGKGIAAGLSGFGDTMKDMKNDSMYNKLSDELFPVPRAQAVDPAMQGPADARAASMPGFHQGGADEFKARMQMQDIRDKSMDRRIDNERSAAYLGMQQRNIDSDNDREERQLKLRQEQEAAKRLAATDGKLENTYKNYQGYLATREKIETHLNTAKTPEEHAAEARSLLAWHAAGAKMGLDVGPQPQIAPFMTQEQKDAIALQEQAVKDAQGGVAEAEKSDPGWGIPGWIPGVTSKDELITGKKNELEGASKSLEQMKSEIKPYTVPPEYAAPAQAAQGSQGGGSMTTISSQEASAKAGKPIKPGTILTDKNGNRILVN